MSAGATGWVRNEYDGSVMLEIQGTPAQVDQVVCSLSNGRYIRIDRTESCDLPYEEDERSFRVR